MSKIKVKRIRPDICNLCGGAVEYVSNALIYGKPYGSGYCYRCKNCGGYVGTHKVSPKDALGIIANDSMRKAKMRCHDLFDSMWSNSKERQALYAWLAGKLNICVDDCHFGYFDVDMLNKAYGILIERSKV